MFKELEEGKCDWTEEWQEMKVVNGARTES